MSYTHEVTIWCDGGCGEWHTGDSAGQMRKILRRQGWKSAAGGRDLCPGCQAEGVDADPIFGRRD